MRVRPTPGDAPAPIRTRREIKTEHKAKIADEESADEVSDDDIWAALEEACKELGYSEEDIADMLRPEGARARCMYSGIL